MLQHSVHSARHLSGTLNQALWRTVSDEQLQPYRVYAHTAYQFRDLATPPLDPKLLRSFRYYNAASQHAYIYHLKRPTLLEPVHGYALWGARIVRQSMPYAHYGGYPSWVGTQTRRVLRRAHHEPAVISLREFGDTNYYHFYCDVLGRLALLDQHGLGKDWPLVISRRLYEMPFFRAFHQRSRLAQRRWIVQDDQPVSADQVLVCKALPHTRATFDWVLDGLDLPYATTPDHDRIFLTRSAQRGRWLDNNDQVAQVCAEYGFRVVDADHLSFDQQIVCFSQARYIVGIHGAGLTNIIFRRGAALGMLELFPPDNLPPHYFWLAHQYGFRYDALVGAASTTPGAFSVDVNMLRVKLDQLLVDMPALQLY